MRRLNLRRRRVYLSVLSLALLCTLLLAPVRAWAQSSGNPVSEADTGSVSGTVIHILESPAEVAGNPSLASINHQGMSCSVSFGNNLGGPENFGMVVYSEEMGDTLAIGRMAIQWGKARSITLQDGEIVESAVYDYFVLARDESEAGGQDFWSMTLWGTELMFDGVTFSGPVTVGDLIIQP